MSIHPLLPGAALALLALLVALAWPSTMLAQNQPLARPGDTYSAPAPDVDRALTQRAPTTRPGELAQPQMPAPLEMADQSARLIFNLARQGSWERTRRPMSSLERAIRQLPADMAEPGDDMGELNGALRALEQAAAARNKEQAIRSANEISAIIARMAEHYQPQVPAEFRLLAVYARQLQTDAAARDSDAARRTIEQIADTWQRLQPKLRAGDARLEVRRLGNLVERLERARTTRDYRRLSESLEQEAEDARERFLPTPSRTTGDRPPPPTAPGSSGRHELSD